MPSPTAPGGPSPTGAAPAPAPPSSRRRPRPALLPLLLLLLGLGSGGLWIGQHQRRQAATPATTLPRRIAAIGRVEPLDRVVKLSVPSSLSQDAVRAVLVQEGQQVTKGQALATLESIDSLQTAVQEAERMVTVAERKLTAQTSVINRYRGELQQADVEVRRYSELYAVGASSAELRDRRLTIQSTTRANLEQAIADRQTLQAELEQQRATLAKQRAELAKATIRAPFAGTIFKINANPGDKVGDGGIFEIGNSSRMGVIAEVYQSDRPGIALGQRVVITADGFPGRSLEGQVVAIARQVSRQTVFSGEAGENLDRRVLEVKIALNPRATAIASTMNYLQVNVLFDPLSEGQRQQQQQRLETLVQEQQRPATNTRRP